MIEATPVAEPPIEPIESPFQAWIEADKYRQSAICPICIEKGKSEEDASKEHSHPPKEIILYANKQARKEPQLEGYTGAHQIWEFELGTIYQIHTYPYKITTIWLSPDEELYRKTIPTGDASKKKWVFDVGLQGEPGNQRDFIAVSPIRCSLKNNVVLVTTKRYYYLEIISPKCGKKKVDDPPFMAGVSWTYPKEEALKKEMKRQREAQRARIEELSPQRFKLNCSSYKIYNIGKGDNPHWTPERVCRTDRKTYIYFKDNIILTHAPVLHVTSFDKGEGGNIINYRVHENTYIVDFIPDFMDLSIGDKKIRIERTG
jgi:P-type conjugative transfer protein TrbG